jgi:hypothetical protein
MPEILDPMEVKRMRANSSWSVYYALMSETKRLYLRSKTLRMPAVREKRQYLDQQRDFFKLLAKGGQTGFVFETFGSLATTSGQWSAAEPPKRFSSTVAASPRQLFRKLKSELSPDTFEELRQVIRAEGVAEVIARWSKDGIRSDKSFISRARELDARGHTDAALDLIYDSVDKLMRDGQFSKLDAILSGVPVASLTADILLGLLTASLPARNRLPSRKPLFRQIEQTFKNRGQLEPGLLTGLE